MITINVNIDGKELLTEISSKLDTVIEGIRIMSEQGEAVKQLISDVSAKVDDLSNDVTTLIGMLPSSGGMTAEEVAEVRTALEALKAKTTSAADLFPQA